MMKKILVSILVLVIFVIALILFLEQYSSYTPSRTINLEAPVKTHQTIIIDAPVKKVWKVFTDVDNWKQWQRNITDSKINGDVNEGAVIDWQTAGFSIHSTLHTVEPLKKIGWSGKAFGSFAIHYWTFEEHGGKTIVTVEESMEGWLVSLMKGYLRANLGSETMDWLNDLKNKSEL